MKLETLLTALAARANQCLQRAALVNLQSLVQCQTLTALNNRDSRFGIKGRRLRLFSLASLSSSQRIEQICIQRPHVPHQTFVLRLHRNLKLFPLVKLTNISREAIILIIDFHFQDPRE